jgi:hypothetical protein
MNINLNIAIILLILAMASCSTQKFITPISVSEQAFLTEDSVFSVVPSYEISSNCFSVKFELTKLKASGEYYFPSSEQLRVIIKDVNGKTILNTAGDKNFLTSISPLEPQEVGEKQEYSFALDGFPLFEDRDEIELVMILPVKPNEIYFEKKINIKSDEH